MSESGISQEARVHTGGGEYSGPTDSGGFVGVRLSVAGQEAVDRAARLLAGVEGGVEKAVRSAMSKAVARLRHSNVSAVRERYAISAANILFIQQRGAGLCPLQRGPHSAVPF